MNQWHHLVSDLEGAGEIHIHQDLNLLHRKSTKGSLLYLKWNQPLRYKYSVLKENWE